MLKNWRKRWRATWNPSMYHGWGKERSYFEGWYYKWVDPTEKHALAVIPGIAMDPDGSKHAFVQVFDGVNCQAWYHEFPEESFQPSAEGFALQLGDNYFSADEVRLNLPNLQGDLKFENPHPWPKMLGAPGIMGWYSFVPFMECYHGVVSVHHRLAGNMTLNDTVIDFSGGIGYGEKDWGISFPSAWIWMQSNHFDTEEPMCLMASVAVIPWLSSSFVGFIVGFLHKGKLHRFATYTGAKMKVEIEGRCVNLTFSEKHRKLEIHACAAEGADLISPLSGDMRGKVNESLQGQLQVRFEENGKEVFSGTGRHSGLELAGELERLTE